MRKVKCFFDTAEAAEYAKTRILSECGGDCRINDHYIDEKYSDLPMYLTPSNYGVNITPQTPADVGAWQTITPIMKNKDKTSNIKCSLSYIGFCSQVKRAEHLLINLHAENITNEPFPKNQKTVSINRSQFDGE